MKSTQSTNPINVIMHCNSAPPIFMGGVDFSRSAVKEIGKGVYKGPGGEIYIECSDEEKRAYFRLKIKQALQQLRTASGLPEPPGVGEFFDAAIAKLEENTNV